MVIQLWSFATLVKHVRWIIHMTMTHNFKTLTLVHLFTFKTLICKCLRFLSAYLFISFKVHYHLTRALSCTKVCTPVNSEQGAFGSLPNQRCNKPRSGAFSTCEPWISPKTWMIWQTILVRKHSDLDICLLLPADKNWSVKRQKTCKWWQDANTNQWDEIPNTSSSIVVYEATLSISQLLIFSDEWANFNDVYSWTVFFLWCSENIHHSCQIIFTGLQP